MRSLGRRVLDALDALPSRLWRGLRRIRVATIVGLALAAALGLVLFSLGEEERSQRVGSEVVEDEGPPVTFSDRPESVRIVYRVENRGGGTLVERTEEVWVRRPFDGRVENRGGRPPGEGDPSTTVTAFGRLATFPANAQPTVLAVPPAPAVADLPAATALEVAVERGVAERRERRRIDAVDRECQVYRIGGPVGNGVIVPLGTVDGEHADVCVDDQGLVLEEVDVVDASRVLRRRIAVEIEVDPELGGEVFDTGGAEPPPADQGGGSILEVDPGSRPPVDEFFEVPRRPGGFEYRGRYAVIPPQAEAFGDPLQQGRRVAGVSDVWVSGAELLVVDQGGTLGRVDAFEDHPYALPVQAGRLGEAELILGLRISEVRVALPEGRYVRVYGTGDPALLVEIARSLRPEPGGELIYLEAPPAA